MTMILRARLFVALSALVLATCFVAKPRVAHAQDDATIQMARERFQEGVKYYDQKQYDKARAAFLQAYALKKHHAVLLNLAQSELRSNHEADAAKHFAQYLREARDASAAEKTEAEKGLAAAKVSVSEVAISVPADAEVFIDGDPQGRSPLPGAVYLAPGTHSFEARKDGKTATASLAATAGQVTSVDLSFGGGSPPAVAPVPGTPPGGAPPPGSVPPPNGGEGAQGGFVADTGGGRQGFVPWFVENKLAWVGGGLTLVGLGVGIGFALQSKQSYDDATSIKNQIVQRANAESVDGPCAGGGQVTGATDYRAACKRFDDRTSDGDTQKGVATAGFVIAGLAAAGTVAYYFVDSGKKKQSGKRRAPRTGLRAGVAPVLNPASRGLLVVGEF
jgi:tetratricopeptide (TPR) repeat protein